MPIPLLRRPMLQPQREHKHNTKYTPSGEKRQSCEVCLNASEKFISIV